MAASSGKPGRPWAAAGMWVKQGHSEEVALGMADRDPGRSPGTASPVVLESSGCPRGVEQAAGCTGRHRAQSPGRRGKEVLEAASGLAHTQE